MGSRARVIRVDPHGERLHVVGGDERIGVVRDSPPFAHEMSFVHQQDG